MSDEAMQEAPQSAEISEADTRPGGETTGGTSGEQLPSWQYAEGVAGSGDVPDWFLADKYKSVADQAKAAGELRRKLGSRAEDAPEHYELDYEKYKIDKDDVVLQEFNQFFKEINLPQSDYEKIIGKFVDIQSRQQEIMQKQQESVQESFTPETKETIGRLNGWMNNNFSPEEQALMKGFMGSPEEIRLLDKLRAGAPKSAPPTINQTASYAKAESLKSINDEIGQNWDRMQSDVTYRNMMNQKRREAALRERGQ